MSQLEHESGSDRIAEAVRHMEADIVVKVQGDEPFQDRKSLKDLVDVFKNEQVRVSSMMSQIRDKEEIQSPNAVKVVVDHQNFALYFSRSPIPFQRNLDINIPIFRHIGVYAYRKEILMAFTQMEKSILEQTEMLEQLRLLENGIKIKMVESNHQSVAIDTKEDLVKATAYYKKHFR